MDFERTGDETALYERYRKLDARDDATPDGGWRRLAAEQVMALPVPRDHGGLGLDAATCAYALEGLGYGYRDIGLLIAVGAHTWAVELPLLRFGTARQRQEYLPALASGRLVGAHAITETESGSDALSLASVARRDGTRYILGGRKRFVANAPTADVFIVYATLGREFGFTGVTAFLVHRDQPGVRVEEERRKSGLRSCGWGQVVLDECVVDRNRLLGAEKQGSAIFATVMAWERTLLLAPLLGAMERQIEECVARARSRRQFGRRIGSFQSVANRIVDMRLRLEAARGLVYRAAWELSRNERSMFAELAKLAVSETAVAVFQDAMEIFGADGYTEDAGMAERLRDALGTRVSSGTSDLQRSVVAAKLGLR